MRTFCLWLLLTGAVCAEEVDEATKLRALKLGYMLNGDSMVRQPHMGSIDVRELLEITKPQVRVIPLARGGPK